MKEKSGTVSGVVRVRLAVSRWFSFLRGGRLGREWNPVAWPAVP